MPTKKKKSPETLAKVRARWANRTPEDKAAIRVKQLARRRATNTLEAKKAYDAARIAGLTPEQAELRADAAKARARIKRYGLDLTGYEVMLQIQRDACAICATSFTTTRACVDHCHTSGRVRAILCHPCNVSLGFMQDDPERLMAAARYLLTHKG
jgi:hypothetical protein